MSGDVENPKMNLKKTTSILLFIVLFCGFYMLLDRCQAAETPSHGRVRVLLQKAQAYSRKGEYSTALNLCNQALRLQPRNMHIFYQRAFVWGQAGLYVNAVKDFTLVIKNDKYFSHAPRCRADCLVALGYPQKAVDDYLFFLKSDSRDGKVWSYLVEAYALMGNRDKALWAADQGLATGSHWSGRLRKLKMQVLMGEK